MPWLYSWQPAIVTEATKATATIGFKDGTTGEIQVADLGWARRVRRKAALARRANATTDMLKVGDIVAVEPLVEDGNAYPDGTLRAAPDAGDQRRDGRDGSAYRPRAGDDRRLVAISRSRVQPRHPGEAPAGLVLQADRLSGGAGQRLHALDHDPRRADRASTRARACRCGGRRTTRRTSSAPPPCAVGLEKSRNLMTVRMAQTIGMAKVAEMAATPRRHRQHAADARHVAGRRRDHACCAWPAPMPRSSTAARRSSRPSSTACRTANGWTIYRHDQRPCDGCQMSTYDGEAPPEIPGHAPAGARSRAPPIRWSRCWKAWCSAAPARR